MRSDPGGGGIQDRRWDCHEEGHTHRARHGDAAAERPDIRSLVSTVVPGADEVGEGMRMRLQMAGVMVNVQETQENC